MGTEKFRQGRRTYPPSCSVLARTPRAAGAALGSLLILTKTQIGHGLLWKRPHQAAHEHLQPPCGNRAGTGRTG